MNQELFDRNILKPNLRDCWAESGLVIGALGERQTNLF